MRVSSTPISYLATTLYSRDDVIYQYRTTRCELITIGIWVYFSITLLLMVQFFFEEEEYYSGKHHVPKSISFLEPEVISHTTMVFHLLIMLSSLFGVITSAILIFAIYSVKNSSTRTKSSPKLEKNSSFEIEEEEEKKKKEKQEVAEEGEKKTKKENTKERKEKKKKKKKKKKERNKDT
ncbi:hypothetical protein M8J77_019710 [Diaphorina citri]|nr:hypothetical protein M8J77_019710 [Diaphorina citri]